MKRKFNSEKCSNNFIPIVIGLIVAFAMLYVFSNPETFLTTMR